MHFGLGKHLFANDLADIQDYLRAEYAYLIIYSICLPAVKMSILLFYYRVFNTRPWVTILRAVGLFIALWSVTAFLVALNQCRPIRFFWDKSIDGSCVNSYAWIMSEGAITISLDLILLLLPMPMVWKLKIPRKQKAALSTVFLLGSLYVDPCVHVVG